jgi:hypothetical protein
VTCLPGLDAPTTYETSPLLVIVPSRGRPESIAALCSAWGKTAEGGLADLLICIDTDDPAEPDYLDVALEEGAMLTIRTRDGFAPRLSAEAVQWAPRYRMLASWGDDHRPRTAGWDRTIVDELERLGSGFVYTNDLIQGENLPTACAMTSDVVEALGWMTPPGFQHLFVDNVWLTLGRTWGRITYLPDVVVEHCHPIAGTADWDDLYREGNSHAVEVADGDLFEKWRLTEMDDDVAKLRRLVP